MKREQIGCGWHIGVGGELDLKWSDLEQCIDFHSVDEYDNMDKQLSRNLFYNSNQVEQWKKKRGRIKMMIHWRKQQLNWKKLLVALFFYDRIRNKSFWANPFCNRKND